MKKTIRIYKENKGLNADGSKNYFYTIIKTIKVEE